MWGSLKGKEYETYCGRIKTQQNLTVPLETLQRVNSNVSRRYAGYIRHKNAKPSATPHKKRIRQSVELTLVYQVGNNTLVVVVVVVVVVVIVLVEVMVVVVVAAAAAAVAVVVVVAVVTVFRCMARLIPFPPMLNWAVSAFSMTQCVIYFILTTKYSYKKHTVCRRCCIVIGVYWHTAWREIKYRFVDKHYKKRAASRS